MEEARIDTPPHGADQSKWETGGSFLKLFLCQSALEATRFLWRKLSSSRETARTH